MQAKIIALAEKYRGLFDARENGPTPWWVLETAPRIGERRLATVREMLSPFPEEDSMLVSVFPTEFCRGSYTDDLVPAARALPGFDKKESEKEPDPFCDDVGGLSVVTGFYLTDNGLGSYSYGAFPSLCAEYIPYADIKGYVREGAVECFAYVRRSRPDKEGGAESVETQTIALLYCPLFFADHRVFFQDLFALLRSEGRLFAAGAA